MKHPQIMLLPLLLMPLSICAAECSKLETINWLAGQWVSVSENSVTSERWQPVSDSSWEGSGETRDKSSGELRSYESLRLVEMSGEVFFIAKVAHNTHPVAFTLTECSDSGAVFENPDHDFPRKIEYILQTPGDLHARVSDGAENGFEIRFQKTKKAAKAGK